MEIGTIGAGPFAQAFAKQASKAGHRLKLSNRRGLESLREIVDQLGPGAQAATKEEAAACEMVLLAVPWDNVPETLASLSGWDNQILIDAINPYHGGAGNFTPADVGNLSTSQLVAALARGARVVKALNNLTVRNLEADPIANGARRVAFVSADDDGAKKQVETPVAMSSVIANCLSTVTACSAPCRTPRTRCRRRCFVPGGIATASRRAVAPMALPSGYERLPRKYLCGVVPSIVRNISMKALTLS